MAVAESPTSWGKQRKHSAKRSSCAFAVSIQPSSVSSVPPSLFERESPTDFLRSPVDALELRLRIQALLARTRRTSEVFRSVLRAGPLSLDRLARTLTVNDVEVSLRRAECAVLEFLLDHSERFVPSKELNRVVLNGSVGGNAARNQVYELRQRLGAAGAPDAIQYLRGRGYRVRWPVAR